MSELIKKTKKKKQNKKKRKGTEEGLKALPGMVLAQGRCDTREADHTDGCFSRCDPHRTWQACRAW